MATRNTMVHWSLEPKHAATVAAHHTNAAAICAFHRIIMPDAPLAVPSMAATTATKMCWLNLPLKPRAGSSKVIDTPMATQIEKMARPIVVPGFCLSWLFCFLWIMAQHSAHAIIIVTSQAQGQWVQAVQAMAT